MAIYFRARHRREVSASEALDERGILRHGYGQRVPHSMRDGFSRLIDARAFWDQNRANLLVVDPRRVGGTQGNKPGYRVFDDDMGRQAIADARASYIRDLENAWRNPPRDAFGSYPYTGAAEGGQCTINGAPGVLVKEDGVLVCKPVGEVSSFRPVGADAAPPRDPEEDEDDDDEDEDDGDETATSDRMLDVDAMSANHQLKMQRDFYDAYAREICEAWRKR